MANRKCTICSACEPYYAIQSELKFIAILTVWLCLQTAQILLCRDLAIFVRQTTADKPTALPLVHAYT